MSDDFPTWLIALIAVAGSIFFIVTLCCIWRCCCRRNHDKTFRWIERLGIPQAKEGQPTEEEFQREMKVHVDISTLQRNHNKGYESDDEAEEQRPRQPSEPDEPEPFKRLNQLGIPRARIEPSPVGVRKPPSVPLPNPTHGKESDSSDEEISVQMSARSSCDSIARYV